MNTQGRNWTRGLLLAAVLGLAGAAAAPMILTAPTEARSAAEQDGKIAWTTDYTAAQAAARKSGKPLLVEFYADWCPPCRLMDETTFRDPKVIELTRRFVPVRVDVDRNEALAGQFGVNGIPRAFILSPTCQVLLSAEGYHDASGFADFLRQGLAKQGRK